MDHNVSGFEVLAKTEYISRHNNAATYLHWSICKDHDIEVTDKWYEHEPETVMHNIKITTSPTCRTCQSILIEL